MKKAFTPIRAAVLMLIFTSLACQTFPGGNTTGATSVPAQNTSESTEASAPKLPDPISPSGAGMACFGLREGGLSCLDESGWKTYDSKNTTLSSASFTDGTLCPDGRIALAHYSGISLFDGANWAHIAKTDGYSSAENIACAADGSIWVAHFKGISHYKQGNWKTYSSTELATGASASEIVYGIAIGVDNKVWAVTLRSVAQFNDNKWIIYEKGKGFEEELFFNAITIDAKGRPWAGYSNGAAVYEDGGWKLLKKTEYASPEAMSFDAKGQLWMASSSSGLSVFNGNTWAAYSRKSKELSSDSVNAIASDSLGRTWVATSYGLTVFDGKAWQTYRMENSDLGDNNIKFAVVVKDGPTLPAPVEKEKASLTGTLNDADNKPLSGMRVEICVESLLSNFKGETPCSEQPFTLSTKTDETGAFTFENVPAGYYIIVSETSSGWAQLTDKFGIGSERTLVKAGEKHDIGTLTLEKKK